MRNWEMEQWSGGIGALLVIGSALPALLGTVNLLLPWPVWIALFASVLAALLVLWGYESSNRTQRAFYAVLVLLSWVVVVTAPEATLRGLSTIFVAGAAAGVYVLRLPMNIAVAVLNTVAGTYAVSRIVTDQFLLVGFSAFLLLLQCSLICVFHILRREQRLRAELGEAYVGRRAAEMILSETARSAERLRIARELHDNVGHQLTLLNLKIEAMKYKLDESSRGEIETVQDVSRALLGDVRATVSDMRTSHVSSLGTALSDLGKSVPNLEVTVEVVGDFQVDEAQQITLLRAVQEIVTNTIRHASARELSILVTSETERIFLVTRDDGKGATPLIPGNGLRGLSERFAHSGGSVEFRSENGFETRAWIPVQ